jgi:hypothetical protein
MLQVRFSQKKRAIRGWRKFRNIRITMAMKSNMTVARHVARKGEKKNLNKFFSNKA